MDAVQAANILSWVLQTALIASAGALLGAMVRIPHARARLMYCHAVMLAAILLPLFQPVEGKLAIATAPAAPPMAAEAAAPGLSRSMLLLIVLAGGAFVRFVWLAAGLVQLRRLRRHSLGFETIPEALYGARRLSGADVSFRVSGSIASPATLGHIDPVVLLPRSFSTMSERAQRAIAVHELLHVKRNDWLRTMIEHGFTVLFWFNPGMWWLVAESRLCREEIVDGDVVALTAERVEYVGALLAFARVKPGFTPLPATRFFSRRQLAHRMQAIVGPQHRSAGSLVVSCSARIAMVLACTLFSFILFPMQGRTQVFALSKSLSSPPVMFFAPTATMEVTAELVRVQAERASWNIAGAAGNTPPRHNVVFMVRDIQTHRNFDLGVPPGIGMTVPAGIVALRAIRPGTVIPPAEIELLLKEIPREHAIEITQDSNNVVTRVVMRRGALRSASNEIDVLTSDFFVGAVRDGAATVPADSADGID